MIEPVVVRTLEGAEFHQNSPVLSLVKIPVKSAQWAQMGGSYIYKVLNCDAILLHYLFAFGDREAPTGRRVLPLPHHQLRDRLRTP